MHMAPSQCLPLQSVPYPLHLLYPSKSSDSVLQSCLMAMLQCYGNCLVNRDSSSPCRWTATVGQLPALHTESSGIGDELVSEPVTISPESCNIALLVDGTYTGPKSKWIVKVNCKEGISAGHKGLDRLLPSLEVTAAFLGGVPFSDLLCICIAKQHNAEAKQIQQPVVSVMWLW